MKQSTLKKMGQAIYYLYTLKSEGLSFNEYNRILKTVSDVLLDIAPVEPTIKILNPDIEEFVETTNRRLNNG